MGLLNMDGISLMAFSTEEVVEQWRNEVIERERARTQRLDSTRYTRVAHTNVYRQTVHRNTYSQAAYRDSYSQRTHRNYYTNRAGGTSYSNSYSQRAARNRHTDSHTNYRKTSVGNLGRGVAIGTGYTAYSRHTKRYSRSYARSAHTNRHSNSYSRNAYRNYYTQSAHRNSYSQVAHRNVYYQVPHVNSYSQVVARDTGFDHTNYIPSAPDIYNVDGNILTGTLEAKLASYDKNNDGEGSQDENSKTIYYTVKTRRIQDLKGNAVNESWKVVHANSTSPDFDVNLREYEDGIYELSTQAYNLPRTEKGVTKTYASPEKIVTFTIADDVLGADLTVINASEFKEYAYGIERYTTESKEIKKYIDDIIYKNGTEKQQKGLFLEIDLKDVDTNTYHKVKAGLKKGDTVIAKGYDVVFETYEDGSPIPGDKTGVVFIPLSDMLDNGSFADVNITLDLTEYRDAEFKDQKGILWQVLGISEAKETIFIDVDNDYPIIMMTPPSTKDVPGQNININFADAGLGLRESHYQVVKAGEKLKDDKWVKVDGKKASILLKEEGTYEIYAKAVDWAGNQTIEHRTSYKIGAPKAELKTPRAIYQGSSFDSVGIISTAHKVTKTKFWVENYGGEVIGAFEEEKDFDGYKDEYYRANLSVPLSIPEGKHVVFLEATLENGKVVKTSKTIRVVSTDVKLADGPRYIGKDFLNSIAPDSIWIREDYEEALMKSLDREDPVMEYELNPPEDEEDPE